MTSALAGLSRTLAAQLPTAAPGSQVPTEIPVVHFSDALAIAGAPPGEPDLAPAHERAIGRWAAETPHGGFAVGLQRWTGRVTGAENIREVTLFPRDLHRLTPLGPGWPGAAGRQQ